MIGAGFAKCLKFNGVLVQNLGDCGLVPPLMPYMKVIWFVLLVSMLLERGVC